jgi:transposase
MIRVVLSEMQVSELEQVFKETDSRKMRDRVQIVLMAQRGRPRQHITADLGVNCRTVQRWINAYLQQGVEGLEPRKAPGAPARVPESLADEIKEWVITGPTGQGLDRANWTHEELAAHLGKVHGIRVRRSAMGRFCRMHDIRPYRPTYRFLRGDPTKQEQALIELAELKQQAENGELVLLSQDEARFPMVPTVCATLGVKGHRPVVDTRDCKDLSYVYASVNCVDGRLHTNTLQSPKNAAKQTGKSKTRRLQEAFIGHLDGIAQAYPANENKRVVLLADNAPWHKGPTVRDALARHPHVEVKSLPSYSPKLNVIERLWKVLRRRATHNRMFESLRDLVASIRNNLRYLQTVRSRVISLIKGCYQNRTLSGGV